MKPKHNFALLCLVAYFLTLSILALVRAKEFTYFGILKGYFLVSVLPLILITLIAYRLCGRKIITSSNKAQAVSRGITSAVLITFFTPMLTFIVFRIYEMSAGISALPQPLNFLGESLMFGLGGITYGCLGSLVFGSFLGLSIYSTSSDMAPQLPKN